MSKKLKASKFHSNKGIDNFLVYNYLDFYFDKFSPLFKGTIVDLGCGETPYKNFLLQYFDKYIGVDWPNSIHNLKADIYADLNQDKINIENEISDVVISISTLEHLYNPQNLLKEANRILKKGGVFIIQVPFQWWVHESPHDYYRYTPHGLRYLLEKNGFKNIEVFSIGGFFTMWLLKFNYFISRTIRRFKYWKVLNFMFTPLFVINQIVAPLLDKLDKDPLVDAAGYWIKCEKI